MAYGTNRDMHEHVKPKMGTQCSLAKVKCFDPSSSQLSRPFVLLTGAGMVVSHETRKWTVETISRICLRRLFSVAIV